MKTRKWHLILGVFFAWVLWVESDLEIFNENMALTEKTNEWDLRGAWPTYDECIAIQEKAFKVRLKSAEDSKKSAVQKGVHKEEDFEISSVPNVFIQRSLPRSNWTQGFFCLPGTLDPRPRGK